MATMTARPPRQRGLLCRKSAQQNRQDQRDFSGQAWVIIVTTPIGDNGQCDDPYSRNRKQQLGPNNEANCTNKRRDSERSYPRGRTRRTLAFAPLALSADQQANPDCHYEVDEHGRGYGDILASG